jgi:hypothetical protein
MCARGKVLEVKEMGLRQWLAQHRPRRTSPSHRLDPTATQAPTAEIKRLLREMREAADTLELTVVGIDGALAHVSGQTFSDNPYPRGSTHWQAWLIGWYMRAAHCCGQPGLSRTPSPDNGATSGSN